MTNSTGLLQEDREILSNDKDSNIVILNNDIFLEDYYTSLAKIELQNQELLNARVEAKWHENKLNEAGSLAVQINIEIPSNNLPDVNDFSRGETNSVLDNIRHEVTEYQNLKKHLKETIKNLQLHLETTELRLQKELETTSLRSQKELETTKSRSQKELETTKSRLQKELKTTKSRLQKELETTSLHLQEELENTVFNLNKKLKNTIDKINYNTNKLDELQTKKLKETLIIIGSGIIASWLFHNLIFVIFTMILIWLIRSYLDTN